MTSPATRGTVTAEERYASLSAEREPSLRRARDNAALTIPTLFPEEGTTGHTDFPQPYQSFGARGVNNLSAKLLLALFPPGNSFVRYGVEQEVLNQLEGAGAADARGEIEKALRRTEDMVLERVERGGFRRTASELLKQLIVGGNVLLDLIPKAGSRLHPLTSYVVKRDGEGNAFEIVFFESLDRRTLPEKVTAMLKTPEKSDPKDAKQEAVKVFTRALLVDGVWEIWQEVEGQKIDGTLSKYPKDACPLIPLRWTKVDGQDYGRSHVDDCVGDLRSAESLRKSVVELAAAIAKVVIFVDENGVTDISQVESAENLSVLPGNARDLSVFMLEKAQDLRVAKEELNDIKRDIAASFLLTSSVQRDAERVTAEEIRILANELDQTLGGNYAVLSQELQRPLAAHYLRQLTKEGKVALPRKFVVTRIVTGLEALGRGSDLEKLRVAGSVINELLGPNAAGSILNPSSVATRVFTAVGVEEKGLVLTQEQLQAQQASAIATELATKTAPVMARGAAAPQS